MYLLHEKKRYGKNQSCEIHITTLLIGKARSKTKKKWLSGFGHQMRHFWGFEELARYPSTKERWR